MNTTSDTVLLSPSQQKTAKNNQLVPLDASQGPYADFYNAHAAALQDAFGDTKTVGEKKDMVFFVPGFACSL